MQRHAGGARVTALFLYGTLCHPPLLALVLGRPPAALPARLAGYRVAWAEGQPFPMILPDPAGTADGIVVTRP